LPSIRRQTCKEDERGIAGFDPLPAVVIGGFGPSKKEPDLMNFAFLVVFALELRTK
jgi:hypothetical protein